MTTMQLRTCPLLIALLFWLPFCSLAQRPADNYYNTKWKTIDSLVDRSQLTQSALTQINAVYEHAKQEKNDPQLIKALVYRLRMQANNQEDAEKKAITSLEKELTSAKEPARSILSSILANAYWTYFQQNRYRLYNRTATTAPSEEDIATWSTTDFYKRIVELYLISLKEEKLLQQTKLDSFSPIVVQGNVHNLRPTIFDLLAHQALNFFKTSEIDIDRPDYAFEIDDPAVFADAAAFARHRFVTNDNLSLHFTALQLFQRLITFHLNDAAPAALIDVDIERLGFANSYAVTAEKELSYKKALEHITTQYGDAAAAAQAWYLQAQLLTEKAQRYDPIKDTSNRYAYVTAKAICEKVIAQKDSSEGKTNCRFLLHSILLPTLTLSTEKVNLPDQPFRTLVSWKNFSKLYIHIVAANRQTRDKLGNNAYQETWWTSLLALPVLKNAAQDLPATGDYQLHRTEIKVDALPLGDYAMIASADPSFDLAHSPLVVQFFHVSAISYINHKNDFFVLDRETGKPLPNADVQIYELQYDYKKSMNVLNKGKTYKTDAHGHFLHIKPSSDRGTAERVEITYGKDKLMLDDQPQLYSYMPEQVDAPLPVDYTFTDRYIYRPGQNVYFKGIVIISNTKAKASTIVTGFRTRIGLYDANDTRIDSVSVTTNEFGSYKGQFRLPEGLLNGEFTIRDDSTKQQISIRVEEYKRPKFYVDYDRLQGSYRIGDSIRVHGTAKAYAGNNIDGAAVSYRVVRKARFPWWYSWRFTPSSSEQEIAHGTAITDANGKFDIGFTAIPDRSVSQNADPVFEYTVSADITDLNGESRSGETLVSVGYKSLELSFASPLPDKLPADSLQNIRIAASNLSGEAVPALVNVKIYPLRMPARLIRDRYWLEPDQFVMTKEEYLRSFPLDEYGSEQQKESWPRQASVFDASDSAGKKIVVANNGKKWSPGVYLIEIHAKDKYGQDVKDLKYITLYDAATGSTGYPQYSWISDETAAAEPGDTPAISIGSSAKDLYIIRNTNDANVDYLTLNNESKRTNIAIADSDRGGVGVADVFVKDNRAWFITHRIDVPFTNKDLTVNYRTFRDKTLPGSQEKWELTISGKKTDKVAAEVLTTMYDASLDQFSPHYWSVPGIYNRNYFQRWTTTAGFDDIQSQTHPYQYPYPPSFPKQYDELVSIGYTRMYIRGTRFNTAPAPMAMMSRGRIAADEAGLAAVTYSNSGEMFVHADKMAKNTHTSDSVIGHLTAAPAPDQFPVQVRKNFNETAFFFPDLRTDEQGNLTLSFTMPEALTKWKMMLLAHTKDLAFGYSEKEVITQKQLMVQPNLPRFLREGDRMELGVKVVNLTDSEMTGQMQLELTDPTTGQTADGRFTNRQPNQYFTVGAGQSAVVNFPLDIPYQYSAPLTYRVTARAKNYSDAEEAILPVVSNRMLVTETLPLDMKGDGTKTFKFDKLLQSGSSETLNHHAVTVEFTANPAWYAVQALPYLMEYPYECAEQTFNRFYANALASMIANSSPRMQAIFDRWKNLDSAALKSNLEKNQELRSVLLQETPWVLQGKSESVQKKNIALLFDLNRMSTQLSATIDKLVQMQAPNGGFVWFKGGPDDRYITQYILAGIAHLRQLKAVPAAAKNKIDAIVASALPYLDQKIKEDYTRVLKSAGKNKTTAHYIGYLPVQYLYMRSLLTSPGIPGDVFPAVNYFRKEAQASWQQYGRFTQAMIALALFRTGDVQTGKNIMAAIRQNAIRDPEKGIYWKGMEGGYYWYEAPIETQALLIEAFHTIAPDAAIERDCKTWLLSQKRTHSWPTTKATAEACYALLLDGSDWLTAEREVTIKLGDKTASSSEKGTEAGTGYFKKVFDGPFVNPSMGNISVTMSTRTKSNTASAQPAWGAVYWQYFDNLDRITLPNAGKTPLKLKKRLFVQKNTDRGIVLEPLGENGVLHPGDKVTVRVELTSDRDLEYVHMRDMRASCMEPVNVLSSYKWQGGLGYYESTKDVSTDFFFGNLPRGTYVFEYQLFVQQTGNFSNGVTSIECMYAPEFAYHSEGIRINVEAVLP